MCEEVEWDDYEHWDVWRETPRVARKAHTCNCCTGTILPGSNYLDFATIYDGRATSEKACFGCWVAMVDFTKAHNVTYSPSQMPDELRNCVAQEKGEVDAKESTKRWRDHIAGILRRQRAA
jgi:hypothetical protein